MAKSAPLFSLWLIPVFLCSTIKILLKTRDIQGSHCNPEKGAKKSFRRSDGRNKETIGSLCGTIVFLRKCLHSSLFLTRSPAISTTAWQSWEYGYDAAVTSMEGRSTFLLCTDDNNSIVCGSRNTSDATRKLSNLDRKSRRADSSMPETGGRNAVKYSSRILIFNQS